MSSEIKPGKYKHYKSQKLYEILHIALDSETHEEMIVYKALYHCDKLGSNQVYVRSKTMFFENVNHHGQMVPRFEFIAD